MMRPVKLKDIVNKLDETGEEWLGWLNTENGEIIIVSREYMGIAEDSEEDDDWEKYQDWERDLIQEAMNIVENWDQYEPLPDKYYLHEYRIMERFSYSHDDEAVSRKLCQAITGKGAFRRFKDLIARLGVEDQWYQYRENAFTEMVREWCESKKIPYI